MYVSSFKVPAQPIPVAQRELMFFSDIDDSLRKNDGSNKEGLDRSCKEIQTYEPISVQVFCTGRGPTMASKLSDSLQGFPMMAVATNNGQNLFLNTDHKPTSEFLAGLKLENQDQDWATYLKTICGPWSVEGVQKMLAAQLTADGFQAAPSLPAPRDSFSCFQKTVDGHPILVALPPDQPGYQVRVPDGSPPTEFHKQFGMDLAKKIGDQLTAQGVQWNHGSFPEGGDRFTHYFQPQAVTKGTLQEYLATVKFPNLHYVVGIGDNVNDDHLVPSTVGQAQVFPILAGTHHPDMEQLAKHPHYAHADPGDVGGCIDQHMQTILAAMKANPYPSALITT